MTLGGMHEEGRNDKLIELFEQEGISQERLNFYVRSSMDHYLELHHQVDICLDTFPYNGGTTTLHSLWMGVPTLTLSGDTAAGRTGAAILGQVNLVGFIAHDKAGFLQKGLFWAENIAELSNIRAGLRERFAQSAIGQPELIAAGLNLALRSMWQRWCADLLPESFEITRQKINEENQAASMKAECLKLRIVDV
jgi:predicted O-linked N-acetylglucosamine transferase (SPINDLY family)